jgi:hypothetical protein
VTLAAAISVVAVALSPAGQRSLAVVGLVLAAAAALTGFLRHLSSLLEKRHGIL